MKTNTTYIIIFLCLVIATFVARESKTGFGEFIRNIEKQAVKVASAEDHNELERQGAVRTNIFYSDKADKVSNRKKFLSRGIGGNLSALKCRMKKGQNPCDVEISREWREL